MELQIIAVLLGTVPLGDICSSDNPPSGFLCYFRYVSYYLLHLHRSARDSSSLEYSLQGGKPAVYRPLACPCSTLTISALIYLHGRLLLGLLPLFIGIGIQGEMAGI